MGRVVRWSVTGSAVCRRSGWMVRQALGQVDQVQVLVGCREWRARVLLVAERPSWWVVA